MSNNVDNMVLSDIRTLIEQARHEVAVSVNAGMTLMYWPSESVSTVRYLAADVPLTVSRLLLPCQNNSQRNMGEHNSR